MSNKKSNTLKLVNFKQIIGFQDLKEIFINNGILESKSQDEKNCRTVNLSNCIIAPGFFDPQINGLNDCDFWKMPDFKAIDKLRLELAYSGVVAFCPTIITNSKEHIIKSIDHINSYIKQAKQSIGAQIAGIHLEGIFVTQHGIHNPSYTQKELTPRSLEPYLKENIVLFTLAPELDKTGEAIKLLRENNILVSIGHSNASYKEGEIAIKQHGVKTVTHMFNALRGIKDFSHRSKEKPNIQILENKLLNTTNIEPDTDGIVLAILKAKDVVNMVIADGLHVNQEVIKFLYQVKGKNYFSLTSDMVSENIFKEAQNNNMLGGGQTSLKEEVSNITNWGITKIDDALQAASKPIASQIKATKDLGIGEINFDKPAYLTIWDTTKNTVKGTIIGEEAFFNY